MEIKSGILKGAVNKVVNGASFNKLVPLTAMIGLKKSGDELQLLSTDCSNTLIVKLKDIKGDDFDITIDAEKFSKLISKVSTETIKMEVTDAALVINAGGEFKIDLISDEEGLVSFPVPDLPDLGEAKIKLSAILGAYNINTASLAKTLEKPEFTAYYTDSSCIISTDGSVVTLNDDSLFGGQELAKYLISAQMMALLALNTQEEIKWGYNGSMLRFDADDMIIIGPPLDGVDKYPVDNIKECCNQEFTSSCTLPKQPLLDVLDRLSLFIEKYDDGGAYFNFGRTGLTIKSKKETSIETIKYLQSQNFQSFECLVSIPMLREQLEAHPKDKIELWYGSTDALKIADEGVVQILALLEEGEENGEEK